MVLVSQQARKTVPLKFGSTEDPVGRLCDAIFTLNDIPTALLH